jgi:ATP-dependent 26S proteasome regulatory subunit
MRILPREVDPLVYNMSMEDAGSITFAGIGGLGEQIREIREVVLVFIWEVACCVCKLLIRSNV